MCRSMDRSGSCLVAVTASRNPQTGAVQVLREAHPPKEAEDSEGLRRGTKSPRVDVSNSEKLDHNLQSCAK